MKTWNCLILVAGLLVAADKPKQGETDAEQKKLQGTWMVVSGEASGNKMPQTETEKLRIIITGSKIAFKTPDKAEEMTYKLDPAKKPKEIDITHPKVKDGTVNGIYSIEGDNLKICYSKREKERPDQFATKAGSRQILFILKREKP